MKICPNCNGTKKAGNIPMADGSRMKGVCVICCGTGEVPEWDHIRLSKMVDQTSIQMELMI
jgi:hypothetical protein